MPSAFDCLPVELRLEVLSYLGLGDISILIASSRVFRDTWFSQSKTILKLRASRAVQQDLLDAVSGTSQENPIYKFLHKSLSRNPTKPRPPVQLFDGDNDEFRITSPWLVLHHEPLPDFLSRDDAYLLGMVLHGLMFERRNTGPDRAYPKILAQLCHQSPISFTYLINITLALDKSSPGWEIPCYLAAVEMDVQAWYRLLLSKLRMFAKFDGVKHHENIIQAWRQRADELHDLKIACFFQQLMEETLPAKTNDGVEVSVRKGPRIPNNAISVHITRMLESQAQQSF